MHLLQLLVDRVGTFRQMNAMFPTTPEVATTIIQLRNIPLQPYVFKIKHLHPIFSIDLHKHLVLNQPTLQPFN
jgi:hypothetical protein